MASKSTPGSPNPDVGGKREVAQHHPEGDAKRSLPPWGSPLSERDYEMLEASWILREIADAPMLRRLDHFDGSEIVGQRGNRDCSGILIPYYWPGDTSAFNYRIRRDNPDMEVDKDGKPRLKGKYLGSPKSGNRLYIPPGVTLEQLADVQIPIALVEGKKKALALWRLANHAIDQPRFIPIAIAGVWNWRGTIWKTGGPNGEQLDVKGPIADLSRIAWTGRRVFIVFDTNVHTNDSVKWARKGICRELTSRGADVFFVNLPEGCGVNGVDNLLAAWGPHRVLELFDNAPSGVRLELVRSPQFQSRPEGLFREKASGDQVTQTQLTNYTAVIVADIRLDDGVETKREFEIESELMGRRSSFTVSAAAFVRMDWPIKQMGPAAITFPNQRD